MQKICTLPADKVNDIQKKLIRIASKYPLAAVYDSNSKFNSGSYQNYNLLAGYSSGKNNSSILTSYEQLDSISYKNPNWWMGFITYDLKNRIENLESNNPLKVRWPEMLFFNPELLILQRKDEIAIYSENDEVCSYLLADTDETLYEPGSIKFDPLMTKDQYMERVGKIKQEILLGNIYEINFCQAFQAHAKINPFEHFIVMNNSMKSPFAAFFRYNDQYLLSFSPERFMMKQGTKLVSQPIKGTVKRGSNYFEDNLLKSQLTKDSKERSENIMIVDLVRNDLARIADRNSVKVESLCMIETYPFVHQMVSTISAKIHSKSFSEIINSTFPMGSMTGAPKINAMRLIEKFESVSRGLYSGSVGYISPGMDFDFNVIIRSLQYSSRENYLFYMSGSAITALSDPLKEYDECLLKAYAMNIKSNIVPDATTI